VVARSALERAGFRVITAEDGREGLRIFSKLAGEIVAVLLDMTMPHMSGDEVYRELGQLKPNVPVILSSGYNEQDATRLFAGAGVAGFIQKPYQPMALIDKVRRTLETGHIQAASGGR
jgi:CheY-like chemotaxis protein